MNHQGTKKLETKRLILRKFTMEDAERMYNNWASEGKPDGASRGLQILWNIAY